MGLLGCDEIWMLSQMYKDAHINWHMITGVPRLQKVSNAYGFRYLH